MRIVGNESEKRRKLARNGRKLENPENRKFEKNKKFRKSLKKVPTKFGKKKSEIKK